MAPFEKLLTFLISGWKLDLAVLGKLGALALLVIYLIFSLVVVRQVRLMSRTFHSGAEPYLLAGSWVLVGLASLVLLLGLIIL